MNNQPCVLLSIRPQYCELIAGGKKTIEVRKTRPKIEPPFKCYIYETKDSNFSTNPITNKEYFRGTKERGKVIGEFVCDNVFSFGFEPYNHGEYCVSLGQMTTQELYDKTCLDFEQMYKYIGETWGYGWHISDLVIYDRPKELSKYEKPCPYEKDCIFCKYYDEGSYFGGEPPACNWMGADITRPPQSWCYVEELQT